MAKHTREQGSVSHSYLIQPELFSQYTADANVLSKALSLSPLRCLFLQCITSLSPSLPLLAELANDFDFRYCVFSLGHCYPD